MPNFFRFALASATAFKTHLYDHCRYDCVLSVICLVEPICRIPAVWLLHIRWGLVCLICVGDKSCGCHRSVSISVRRPPSPDPHKATTPRTVRQARPRIFWHLMVNYANLRCEGPDADGFAMAPYRGVWSVFFSNMILPV